MFHMKQKLVSLLLAAGALLSLSACNTGDSASSTQFVPPPPTASTAPPTTTPPRETNLLTGEQDVVPGSSTRPVAVMIGNNDKSRPQYGLDKADLLVEAETEGGITRIMAVFASADRIPAKLGPVRSARSPFVLLAQSLDAVYCHAGGSSAGKNTISTTGVPHIDALVYQGSTYWRDDTLRKTKGAEYSMMTAGEKVAARIASAKIRANTSRGALFSYGDKAGTGAGQTLQVTFSGAQTISFTYDAATSLYKKGNGAFGKASAHKTADGVQLTAANVLVMYDQKFNENNTTISFRLNSGSGLLVSGGTSRNIKWSRTASKLSFTEADGSAATLAPGKTYVCLVTSSNAGSTRVG